MSFFENMHLCSYAHTINLSLLNIWQFQSVPLALVLFLEGEGEEQCYDTEASKYAHGQGIVILLEYLSVDDTLATDAILIEQPSDEQRYEAQADVLYPEDKCIG